MSSTTVSEFATELKKSPETLLEQLKSAGVAKAAASDVLTESDKQHLLSYLQASHGTASPERKKITLVKKSTSEIKQADSTGKVRTIVVEKRKQRTFIRRDEDVEAVEAVSVESVELVPASEAQAEAPSTPVIDHAELARREEEARRQAEFIRRQEEELVERRRQREEQESREREAADKAAAMAAIDEEAQKAKTKATPSSQEAEAEAAALSEAKAKAVVDARQKAIADSKARAEEEAARAADLNERRRKAEAEAAAIRTMMSSPAKKAPVIKKEEPKVVAKAADAAKAGMKGTLHKPATGTGVAKPAAAGAAAGTAGAGKEVKSAKLSSSWAGDPGKKKAIPTRGDTSGGVGRGSWRGGPRGKRGDDRHHHSEQAQSAPVEARVLDVHVPETITVSELAHKMAVKASEVIKHLMKLGQMVTINQSLDQDTAMFVVEEMGH